MTALPDGDTRLLRPTRRTLVRSTAWTVPAVAVGVAAPVYAASPCAGIPFTTGWLVSSPATGSLAGSSGTNGFVTGPGTNGDDGAFRYRSQRDASWLDSATITVTHASLAVVSGRAYNFTISVRSNFSDFDRDDSAGGQRLNVRINGVSHLALTTQAAAGYTLLPTTEGGYTISTHTFTYAAATTGNVTFQYQFTLPTRVNPFQGQDDLAVSAPAITGC